MKFIKFTLALGLLFSSTLFGQNINFESAYQNHPNIPRGVLEAVSWVNTRMNNIGENHQESCTGMPKPYGVMGVFDNGADWFIENGEMIAQLSGISVADQKADINLQVEAYASAFSHVYNQIDAITQGQKIYSTLLSLSHIQLEDDIDRYANDSYIYDVLMRLNEASFADEHNFQQYNLNLAQVFGETNYQILSSPMVFVKPNGIENITGTKYTSQEFAPKVDVIWSSTPSCNYSSRNGVAISAIAIHTIQGSYAGAISWAKNCISNVSYHYVLRSSDGQITQMLQETDKGWHIGSENSYTIGFEHEGWVDEDGWYTTAMYNSSADLVKDICNRRGIDRKRVSYFPWAKTTHHNQAGIPGTCVKIKGHQHYPNQNHTDPGPRWDWEHFDNLINDNVPTTTITSSTGTIYDSGGADGNYSNDERRAWLIAPENASEVSLTFTSFSTENTWDYLYIYDGSSVNATLIGRYTGTNGPGTVTGTSGKLYLLFKSECATTASGWAANISTVEAAPVDNTPPTTEIVVNNDWKTSNFDVQFIDADEVDGSGVHKSFYQVLEFNGHNWTANPNRGFFGDNFDSTSVTNLWTSTEGNWDINSGLYLEQSDEDDGNTNIYAPLNQSLSNQYLYTWSGKISGTGNNRRAGLHIFCDDPTADNRGNSYLIYFRPDASLPTNQPNKEVQLYKSENNVLTLVKEATLTLNADVFYNYALRYDRVTGEFAVYINDNMILSWTDPNPIFTGDYLSFRSGNCIYEVNNLKAYRTRYPEVTIQVGPGNTNDIRFQNSDPDTPAGRIKSIIVDHAGNLSNIAFEDINVDWTPPVDFIVNDGLGEDIDTVYLPTLEANWPDANDPHSGIAAFKLAIGTTPGDDDIYPWSSDGLGINTSITYSLNDPVYDQIYYISIEAINAAGLSTTVSSDGQRLVDQDALTIDTEELLNLTIYPNPTMDMIKIDNLTETISVVIYDMAGNLIINQEVNTDNNSLDIGHLSSGSYNVVLKLKDQFIIKKLIKI